MHKTRVAITAMLLGSLGCAATVSQPSSPKPAPSTQAAPALPKVAMQGAGWVIDHLQSDATPRSAADDAKQAKLGALATEAKALRLEVAKLPAAEYAERWVALAKRYSGTADAKRSMYGMEEDKTLLPLFEAFPEPVGWPALITTLRKHAGARATSTEKAFAILASTLARDAADRSQIIAALAKERSLSPQVSHALRRLTERPIEVFDPSQRPIDPKELEVYVSRVESIASAKPVAGAPPAALPLTPHLLKLGEARAKALITRLVTSANVKLSTEDRETAKLAYTIALANVDKMKVAQWDLVRSIDDLELMRALWKRFGVPAAASKKDGDLSDNDYDDEMYTSGADQPAAPLCQYVLALVKAGEHDGASEIAKQLPAEIWGSHRCVSALQSMDTVAQAGALYSFLSALVKTQPNAPLQTWLGAVSIPAGRGEEFRTLARSALQDPNAKARKHWLQGLFNSLLADDLVQEAKQLARESAAELDVPPRSAPHPAIYASDVGTLFVHIGRLAKDDALIDEGFAISKSIPVDPRRGQKTPEVARCQLLLELQRYAQAEQCIVGAMAKLLQPSDDLQPFASYGGDLPKLLALLTRTYGATGHYGDVITLLERAPWWGASELEDLTDRQDVETTMAVARALHGTGKTQAAVDLLQRRILLGTGDDRPYALLVQIGDPAKLLSWFDAIHAIDRFQERPLMWKAKVFLAQGKLDEAERTAKRALGVDPSDGEAQPGQRIHGYGVMSEILAARGATKDAEFFGTVVRAIRISERADEMRDLGLVKRALATYRQSESTFSDAYCVHWRMADQLHGIGLLDEAKKHYRIAFQHMPHQFGRVASVCMHCADVFGREYVRGIAENVFAEIIAAEPNNARGYHFLAQVRFEQSRSDEGISLLRKAVTIDPEYADAWQELLSKLDRRSIDAREAESIRLRLFELDPLGIHGNGDVHENEIQDLARLWTIAVAHKRLEIPEPPRHVPLPAAAERARALSALATHTGPEHRFQRDRPLPYALPAPGAVLKAQPALSLASALIGADAPVQRAEFSPTAQAW